MWTAFWAAPSASSLTTYDASGHRYHESERRRAVAAACSTPARVKFPMFSVSHQSSMEIRKTAERRALRQ